ncbi:hypothetical protein RRG08_023309 [Elysia crispata]|uniref:Uncharacterized protein n=1 Tax=Elysia crispata TaxID=231223 RepID=A0AAE1BDM5_9GAST|nr:hypothetical protein RRG08_023309 [Elysia crispata]
MEIGEGRRSPGIIQASSSMEHHADRGMELELGTSFGEIESRLTGGPGGRWMRSGYTLNGGKSERDVASVGSPPRSRQTDSRPFGV